MTGLFARFLELPRVYKRIMSVVADVTLLSFALWAAFSLRLERIFVPALPEFYALFFGTVLVTVACFVRLGLYRAVIRFMSTQAVSAVVVGVTISSLAMMVMGFLMHLPVPRSVPVIYWAVALVFTGGTRMAVRGAVGLIDRRKTDKVIIFGAGPTGMQLASALKQGGEYRPVVFIDDDRLKRRTVINGLAVHPSSSLDRLISQFGVKRVLLALDGASRQERAHILQLLEPMAVTVQTVPSMSELVSGKAQISEIRDLEIEDLLGRDAVVPDPELLHACIRDKVVMVTGAGGSIGSELCRQILMLKPSKLVLFEQSEFGLYRIENELKAVVVNEGLSVEVSAIMGSVQKEHRLEVIMSAFGVQTVYHAAAYKHVPMVEHNIVEGVRNNVFGTWYAGEAAIRAGVETFVLISTDKAVRPTNAMGASKRAAELALQALAARQDATRFCMVRFGNVLGSSGSVVPLFREQIRAGGPVTVTHPDIFRYFMTIPEAAQLVLQASSMGQGGEVFVLDMGESVRIADLARKMVHLMGFQVKDEQNPEGDIEVVFTGLRPGEKLFEELLIGDNPQGTGHPRILKAQEVSLSWKEMLAFLEQLDIACHHFECEAVRRLLIEAPIGYTPSSDLADLVWRQGDLCASVDSDSDVDTTHSESQPEVPVESVNRENVRAFVPRR
ncbi:polysaccharide biosynthesis protein [Hydrocarboniclastica marina]|uniref:Polysaccharide biosynthesis protein n=2 Tax=Hydrocarboniclastica marina TaxID=2259620 RepID=A0A4P7XHE5_9ALTE|nr:polysaccharide biosynthesis protein [Hydrocarboniclastica marina]